MARAASSSKKTTPTRSSKRSKRPPSWSSSPLRGTLTELDSPRTQQPPTPTSPTSPTTIEFINIPDDDIDKLKKGELLDTYTKYNLQLPVPPNKKKGTATTVTVAQLKTDLKRKREDKQDDLTQKLKKRCGDLGLPQTGGYETLIKRYKGELGWVYESEDELEGMLLERGLDVPTDPSEKVKQLFVYEWEQVKKKFPSLRDHYVFKEREDVGNNKSPTASPSFKPLSSPKGSLTPPPIPKGKKDKGKGKARPSSKSYEIPDHEFFDDSMCRPTDRVPDEEKIYIESLKLEYFPDRASREEFQCINVKQEGSSLFRAIAVCLWGPDAEPKWKQVMYDIQVMWWAATTRPDSLIYKLRNYNYGMLAQNANWNRPKGEMEETWPDLEDQINYRTYPAEETKEKKTKKKHEIKAPTEGIATNEMLQLVSDCYDVAIHVYAEGLNESHSRNTYFWRAYRGVMKGRSDPDKLQKQRDQKQIFLLDTTWKGENKGWYPLLSESRNVYCTVADDHDADRMDDIFMPHHIPYAPVFTAPDDLLSPNGAAEYFDMLPLSMETPHKNGQLGPRWPRG